MNAFTFLKTLLDKNVVLWREQDKIRFKSCSGIVSSTDKEQLLRYKEEIISLLYQKKISKLSSSQTGLWFLNQFNTTSSNYHIANCFKIKGTLDFDQITKAVQKITNRHEALRSYTLLLEGAPYLTIAESVQAPVALKRCHTREVDALIIKDSNKAFDFANPPLFRCIVYQVNETESYLLIVFHHFISDGWSLGVFARELFQFYNNNGEQLNDVNFQYTDYILQFAEQERRETHQKNMTYMRQYLENYQTLNLPTDFPRPPIQGNSGAMCHCSINNSLVNALQERYKSVGATVFEIFLTAFYILLHRYSNQNDILLATPHANRTSLHMQESIGYYIARLLVRQEINDSETIDVLLGKIQNNFKTIYAHNEYIHEELIDAINPERDLSRNALFQVLFVLQNAHQSLKLNGVDVHYKLIDPGVSRLDLEWHCVYSKDNMELVVIYDTNLYSEDTIETMLHHYTKILELMVLKGPNTISDIQLLSEEDKEYFINQLNDSHKEYNFKPSLYEVFAQNAKLYPNKISIYCGTNKITYAELLNRVDSIAHYLSIKGVKKNDLVALHLHRSIDMVASLLATNKIGGVYLPMDPAFPTSRLEYMIEHSQAMLVLTDLEPDFKCGSKTLYLDDITSQPYPPLSPQYAELAYVLYTSGSTGQPKGISISQKSLLNFLYSMSEEPGITLNDVLLAVTTWSFDISMLELLLPLTNGATLIIALEEESTNPIKLFNLIKDHSVNIMQATPATWQMLCDCEWPGASQLKILCGGDKLPTKLAHVLLDKSASLWNMYGPTETTIWSAVKLLKKSDAIITIGKPVANTGLFVLDPQNNICPIGVCGELCISGDGLALGYLHQKTLTENRFPEISLNNNTQIRIYRTGDQARYLKNGEIQIIGRLDFQIKVRGFRVELGEIESHLLQFNGVKQAVVLVKNELLVAFILTHEAINTDLIRDSLKKSLPLYMIPTQIFVIDEMPMTANKKIDRTALLNKFNSAFTINQPYVAPESTEEQFICSLFERVLNKDKVGLNDNLFQIGGHSLHVAQIIYQIKAQMGVEIPMHEVFLRPTAGELAADLHFERQLMQVADQPELLQELILTLSEERVVSLLERIKNS